MPLELMLLTIVKALAELAMLFLLGQGMLYILAGQKREGNFFYQLLRTVTRPVTRMTRIVTPRFVIDRHIPYAAGLLLFWIWLLVLYLIMQFCQGAGIDCKALKQASIGGATLLAVRIG
jgi:hypothetical protein